MSHNKLAFFVSSIKWSIDQVCVCVCVCVSACVCAYTHTHTAHIRCLCVCVCVCMCVCSWIVALISANAPHASYKTSHVWLERLYKRARSKLDYGNRGVCVWGCGCVCVCMSVSIQNGPIKQIQHPPLYTHTFAHPHVHTRHPIYCLIDNHKATKTWVWLAWLYTDLCVCVWTEVTC